MQLKTVTIKGFRSIDDMFIPFNGNGHRVLVGKNESGKSNILKALNLLSEDAHFDIKDKKEMYEGTAFVQFKFELEEYEIDLAAEKFYEKFVVDLKTKLTEKYTIKQFFEMRSKNILHVLTPKGRKYWTHFVSKLVTNGNWYLSNPNISEAGLEIKIPPGSYVNGNFLNTKFSNQEREVLPTYFTKVSMKEVDQFLRNTIVEICAPEDYTFPVIYWKYNAETHNLPTSMDRTQFSQNPNLCIPLKNIFLISGIAEDQISDKISEAYEKGPNGRKNLLTDINRQTNTFIKKSWKDHGNVKIELRSERDTIAIGIEDSRNTYDFEQRSDGFRRLVSFLLLLSTEEGPADSDNSLILVDEPETGLHPSSAKDLRDKLIELGKENIVVYATHSISMIDTENIENNLIISKENENTKFEIAKEDGASPAELVYQAIGYSIYENLKMTNILLEGYTDKKMLTLCMKDADWNKYGICYTGGIKNIECVFSMLALASRKYFVLSDCDNIAKQKRASLQNPDWWFTYKDLDSDAITLEDFYQPEFFYNIVDKVLKKTQIPPLPETNKVEKNRIEFVKSFLNKSLEESDSKHKVVRTILADIKLECARTIKKTHVLEEKIRPVLDALLTKIRST